MRLLYTLLACTVIGFTAVIMVVGEANFLFSIPIVWAVGELLVPRNE